MAMAADQQPMETTRTSRVKVGFPLRTFSAAAALSLALLSGMVLLQAQSSTRAQRLRAGAAEAARLETEIFHVDEMLTTLTRVGATTGDPAWEQYYRAHERRRQQTLRDARRIATSAEAVQSLATLDATNGDLVAVEQHVFRLIRDGRADEALRLLLEPSYANHKQLYSAALAELGSHIGARARADEVALEAISRSQLMLAVTIWVLIALSWIRAFTSIRQWRRALATSIRDAEESADRAATLATQAATNEAFAESILNAQDAALAILEEDGTIVRTNLAWEALLPSRSDHLATGVGSNYLRTCDEADGDCAEEAREAAAAIRRVLGGAASHESMIYSCHTPGEKRWYRLVVTPINLIDRPGAVVTHYNVTHEIARQRELEINEAYQRQLALVAAHTDNAAILTDRLGRIEWVNQSFTRITGYTLDEVVGRTPGSLLQGPESDPETVQLMRDGIESGSGFDVEIVNYSKEGRKYWVAVEVRPIRNASGDVDRFIAIERDITREKENSRTRRLMKAAIDNSGEMMLMILSDGRIDAANDEACTQLGYTAEELRELSIWDLEQGSSATTWAIDWKRLRADQRALRKSHYRFKDGQTIPVAISMMLVTIDQSDYVVAITRDITSEQLMERALDEERQLLQTVLETIPYQVFWKDANSVYLGCNGNFAEVAGMDCSADIIGKTDYELPWLPEESESYRADDAEVMQSGEPKLHIQETQLRSDGLSAQVDTSKVPLRNANGDVIGVVGIYVDVTEKSRLESQLVQAQKLESIGQLAAGIAHEINTPAQYVGDNTRFVRDEFDGLLKVIDTYAAQIAPGAPHRSWEERSQEIRETLESVDYEYLRDEIPRAIEQTIEGIERISSIVRAMRDFSHPGETEKQPADLNRAIESTVTVCTNRWKYAADLELDLDQDMPNVPCLLGEFNQVMLNLVVNAADAIEAKRSDDSRKGHIIVRSRREDEDAVIQVIDTGGGVPESIRDRIFDPFFTTKEVGKGTGQGLAISRDVIVEKHGGALTLDVEEGVGSTFTIRLPLERFVEHREAA